MNPENNNPLSVPGTPGMDTTSTPGFGGLSDSDSLASAADNLTSAGLAVGTNNNIMGLDQLGSVRPEAIMAPPEEEPLIPAAPVPGSIGSAMSVPAAPQDPADAIPPVPPMPATPAPEAAPVNNVPYNPFATTQPSPAASPAPAASETPQSNPTPVMTGTASMGTKTPDPSAFQPIAPAKKQLSPLVMILGIVSGILLITTIVFFIMFINAKNNTRTIYMPDPNNNASTSLVEVLTCSKEDNLGWLIGEDYSAPGMQSVELSYTNNLLRGFSSTRTAQFADEATAEAAKANLDAQQAELMSRINGSFEASDQIVNGLLTTSISSNNDSFNPMDAAMYIYGLDGAYMSTSLDVLRSMYEGAGYSCNMSN